MAWKDEMVFELQNLQESLQIKKCDIEIGVDKMEEGKKSRDVKKKQILLNEMKQILAKLNEVDKKVVKDLKGEAFDFLRSMRKLSDEIAAIKESLKSAPGSNRSWRTEVNALRVKVENLEMEEFVGCLNISVGIQPGSMIPAFEKVSDAIFLETPVLNLKSLYLEIPERLPTFKIADYNPNVIEIQIHNIGESMPAKFSSVQLQKLMLSMTCQLPGVGIRVFEECSVWSKVEKKKAVVSEDGKHIIIKLQRPNNVLSKISVTLLGSNIVNSPILYQFLNDKTKEPAKPNITMGNDSIGIFDMTGLDQSDINSLDITNRQKSFFPGGKQHLLANPALQPSPAYHPLRRASQLPNVATVPEKLDDTTPFSPYSEGTSSTMRATVAASHLAGALNQWAGNGITGKEGGSTPENSKMDESDLSILAPSKNSAISIDEMQRSLSGSESGAGDRSVFQLDKSVSFAPRTQVVEVLSTPQVTARSGNTRFLVAQGQTKDGDGITGHVRRLNKDDKNGGFEDIWDVTELEEDEVEDDYNPSSAATLPLVASNDYMQYCISPDSSNEDPHLMLNASKAPSPQSSWSREDSIWDVTEVEEEMVDEYNLCSAATLPLEPNNDLVGNSESCISSCLDSYEDPHLMLNASKAPSPQSTWSKEDSIWDWGFEQSNFKSPTRPDNNQTIWETEVPSRVSKFDMREPLEVVNVYESQPIGSTSRRGTKHCLISPHSITYLSQRHSFLVTEPDQNRVGLYDAETFKFSTWMGYPQQFMKTRQNYDYPTSILTLANAFLVLIERNRLHVFDSEGNPFQCIGGEFHGLTEGHAGEVFTLGKNKAGQPVVKKLAKTQSTYKWAGLVLLTSIQEFENWEVLSQARFLLYSSDKIFITDEGLHKLYIVDLSTGNQRVSGYLGSKPGQFKRPTGLMTDNLGNLLVGDSDNNRLVVYTGDGKFIKIVEQEDWRFSSPHDLVRKGSSVLAVFRGEEMGDKGAVVRYRVSGDSGLNTPDTGSEQGN